MNETRVSCLTPPGSGAIATIAVRGSDAWMIVRRLFQPASKKPLPEQPQLRSTWFGKLGEGAGDDVILAVLEWDPEPSIEIHCHGGRQVVRWLIDLFRREGCVDAAENPLTPTLSPEAGEREKIGASKPWDILPHTMTLRTAAILLDQANGAFDRELQDIRQLFESGSDAAAESQLQSLIRYAPVGRHLLEPWRVVIAGAPNAGKSSLLNALAGYQRSIVAPVPGTTRDVVSATLAFDGWLVELSDTAGLRDSCDLLEREGIERAHRELEGADLCLWVIDATTVPPESTPASARVLPVLNKIDLPPAWDIARIPDAVPISAIAGSGLDELIRRMLSILVPDPPAPGVAVPYSVETCELVEMLLHLVKNCRGDEAIARLLDFDRPG